MLNQVQNCRRVTTTGIKLLFKSSLLLSLFIILSSCGGVKFYENPKKIDDVYPYPPEGHNQFSKDSTYFIELNSPVEDKKISGKYVSSIRTNYIPVIYDSCGVKNKVAFYDVSGSEKNYRLDASMIKRITTDAGPNEPPTEIKPIPVIHKCDTFVKDRNGLLWEFKGFAGVRTLGDAEQTKYPYETLIQEDFGFGYAGSKIFTGMDISLVSSFDFLDSIFCKFDTLLCNNCTSLEKLDTIIRKSALQLGIASGFWPVDGSIFAPAGIRIRYTDKMNSYSNSCCPHSCNTWFLYTDGGLLVKVSNDPEKNVKSLGWFADLGIGYELCLSKYHDLSIDIGWRVFGTPLYEIIDAPEECKDNLDLHPSRFSSGPLLRIGFSF